MNAFRNGTGTEVRLLEALYKAGDTCVSGAALGEYLDVSRTAVWKHISKLKSRGYVIETVPFKGYRLISSPDLISESEIQRELECERFGSRVVSFTETESTNQTALELGRQSAPEGTIVVADRQSRGRGRLGRTWLAPGGTGILVSVLLRPITLSPRHTAWLTLMAAVSVTKLIMRHADIEARIKWPNDVLVGDQKICGILTEMVAEQDRIEYAVVGIGLNVNQSRSQFAAQIRPSAASLKTVTGKQFNRARLLRGLLEILEHDYYRLISDGVEDTRQQWMRHSATVGRDVVCRWNDTVVEGKAVGLADDGALMVRQSDGSEIAVVRGDVTYV